MNPAKFTGSRATDFVTTLPPHIQRFIFLMTHRPTPGGGFVQHMRASDLIRTLVMDARATGCPVAADAEKAWGGWDVNIPALVKEKS